MLSEGDCAERFRAHEGYSVAFLSLPRSHWAWTGELCRVIQLVGAEPECSPGSWAGSGDSR